MIYRFTEVLNDLVNYFILGDILLLEDWKRANDLSDDLAMEFTTNESGDRVLAEGIVIPMTGIENYPYTILFNTRSRVWRAGAVQRKKPIAVSEKWLFPQSSS